MRSSNSAFYFGIEITPDNRFLAFDEGNGELLASLRTGKYTPTTLLNEALRAMNEVSVVNNYSGIVDRTNRTAEIVSDNMTFSLLISSGSTSASVFPTLGFTQGDETGFDGYEGASPIGKVYQPQFRLQSWVEFDHNQKAVESTVNVSASGQVEVVRFGVVKLMEAEIKFITDIDQGVGGPIRTNLNGVDDARAFLEYAVTKGPMEFIPDITEPETFNYCVLESTPESRDGVDFKLKELFTQNIVGYFTTGLLTFREVTP